MAAPEYAKYKSVYPYEDLVSSPTDLEEETKMCRDQACLVAMGDLTKVLPDCTTKEGVNMNKMMKDLLAQMQDACKHLLPSGSDNPTETVSTPVPSTSAATGCTAVAAVVLLVPVVETLAAF